MYAINIKNKFVLFFCAKKRKAGKGGNLDVYRLPFA